MRGTKNPDHAAIVALRPDLVVANQEENRRTDVERLRRHGIPVWVTEIESVDGAIASLRRLLTGGLSVPSPGGSSRRPTSGHSPRRCRRSGPWCRSGAPLDGGRVGHLHR